jgi:hypothetical protein
VSPDPGAGGPRATPISSSSASSAAWPRCSRAPEPARPNTRRSRALADGHRCAAWRRAQPHAPARLLGEAAPKRAIAAWCSGTSTRRSGQPSAAQSVQSATVGRPPRRRARPRGARRRQHPGRAARKCSATSGRGADGERGVHDPGQRHQHAEVDRPLRRARAQVYRACGVRPNIGGSGCTEILMIAAIADAPLSDVLEHGQPAERPILRGTRAWRSALARFTITWSIAIPSRRRGSEASSGSSARKTWSHRGELLRSARRARARGAGRREDGRERRGQRLARHQIGRPGPGRVRELTAAKPAATRRGEDEGASGPTTSASGS